MWVSVRSYEIRSIRGSLQSASMQLNPAIFKAYDIRGTTPTTLNEVVAERLGLAFGQRALALGERVVAVGRDGRLSGPGLAQALMRGLVDGMDVASAGELKVALDAGAGAGWIGLRRNGDHTVTGISALPLLPAWLALALVLGAAVMAWRREGR